MKEILNPTEGIKDWGTIEFDHRDRLIHASPDFCKHFLINEEECIGMPMKEIIQVTNNRKFKEVIFGVIFGYSCLFRVSEWNSHQIFRVIIRQDEIELAELFSFVNSITKKQKKKSGNLQYSFDDILGKSQTIEQVKEIAARISTGNSTVLLTGESGTGKELFAQAIHGLSARKNHPFVAVNCAAIPDELFESEVFGYEAGAFSGAKKEGKSGKIELAQHGTLFLDEISELPYQAQGKLLRVLQEREVERLGGTVSKNVDIRIIAATNRDLKMLVHEGKFRQDLFYRLYVFELKIPSLRHRKEDIIPLAFHFIQFFNDQFGQEVRFIDPKLKSWLLEYDWPGNVREFRAYIERGMNIVEGDTLYLNHLTIPSTENLIPLEVNHSPIQSLDEEVKNAEINAIKRALQEAKGDRTEASQMLKIHIASLYRKISKYNLK